MHIHHIHFPHILVNTYCVYLDPVFAASLFTAFTAYCPSERAAYIAYTYIPLHLSLHYARCFLYRRIRSAIRVALLASSRVDFPPLFPPKIFVFSRSSRNYRVVSFLCLSVFLGVFLFKNLNLSVFAHL